MFNFFKKKPKEVVEEPSLEGTQWYVPGINDNLPILEIDAVTDNIVHAHFIEEANLGKNHTQPLKQFLNCFSRY